MNRWIQAIAGAALCVAVIAGCATKESEDGPFLPAPLRLDRSQPYAPSGSVGSAPTPVVPQPAPLPSGPTAVAYRLRVGDAIVVAVRTPAEQQFELVIDEHGLIKLPLIPDVRAAGMTGSELERTIKNAYISNKIYRDVTVNVVVPQRSYFVRGEVRAPGRYPIMGGMTLLQAIATAGGYTEFANPRRIQVSRGGQQISADAYEIERNPDGDIAIETGDVIVVPRRIF